MQTFQVRNIAGAFKVTEDEVRAVISGLGYRNLESANFKKVDNVFKERDWQRCKVEWNKFKGVSIKISKDGFDVNKGLVRDLKRFFEHDDIRVPEGWIESAEINGRMVSFFPCRVYGLEKCDHRALCMKVKMYGTRQQMMDGQGLSASMLYIMPYWAIVRTIKEIGGDVIRFEDYLTQNAKVSFNYEQQEAWIREKKLRIYTGHI